MYGAELRLKDALYHNARLLVRSRYLWLVNAVAEKPFLELLVSTSKLHPELHELRYKLPPGADLRVGSLDDVYAILQLSESDNAIKLFLEQYAEKIGVSNIIQSLANMHPLLMLHSLAQGCPSPDTVCILEPSIEVDSHETLAQLRKKRLLPYRLFDLLLAQPQTRHLYFIELKYSKSGKRSLPAGTLLAYIASFLEKLVSTEQLIGSTLKRSGYSHHYSLIVILQSGQTVDESVRKHAERIAENISALTSTAVRIEFARYTEIVNKAQRELKKSNETANLLKQREDV
jgi:hypothetical protein